MSSSIILTSRIPYTLENPLRPQRPATTKIIFLSLEGSATEEDYFAWVSQLFDEVKAKIQFISVAEDAVHTREKNRTNEQRSMLGKSKPKQLVEKIEQFKAERNEKYQFDKYEDEFWIVSDIDGNLSDAKVEEFHQALDACEEKGYCGAPLRDSKHIRGEDYTKENIIQAVERAKALHTDREGRYPKYLATTVYQLLDKVIEMAEKNNIKMIR